MSSRIAHLLRPIRQSRPLTRTTYVAPFSTSSSNLSTAGYGDPAHEGENNSGTKTPSSAPNPNSRSTDQERSSSTPAHGGSKKVKGNEPLPEAKFAMGGEGGGKDGPPAEEKKIGEKPHPAK